jgi:hypothetical protein
MFVFPVEIIFIIPGFFLNKIFFVSSAMNIKNNIQQKNFAECLSAGIVKNKE